MKFIVKAIVFGFILILKAFCEHYMGENVDWYPTLNDYKFHPKIGDCYEIYDQTEIVTPLICQRPKNPERYSCIYMVQDEKYCLVLKTPTNETIQLLCEDSEQRLLSYHLDFEVNSCYNVSRPDKSYIEVCQKTFDNYSIGITTLDNFTVLFDSYFCNTFISISDKNKYDIFTSTLFDPDSKSCYKIYQEDQQISPYTCFNNDVFTSCIQELTHFENCEGIITQNNETVILQCNGDSASLQKGNFRIYTAANTLHLVEQKKVEERCIGITTPSNLTVVLQCFFCSKPNIKYESYDVQSQKKHRKFIKEYLSAENLRKQSFINRTKFNTYRQNNISELYPFSKKSIVYAHWLPNSNCYGFTLDSKETIILECITNVSITMNPLRAGCFAVLNPNIKKDQSVCIEIINEECVGITTPLNWTVELDCYPEESLNQVEQIKRQYAHKSAEEFDLFLVLHNCYEVYHSQEINPYSCTKSTKPENYACIDWIPGKKQCLGLKIPSNETIEFVCSESAEDVLSYKSYSSIKECFTVYTPNNSSEKICLQKYGDYSVGVTTPNNYSILFDSFFCSAVKDPEEILNYKDFINNFTFDPNIRSCYKVFESNQDINPYSCLSIDVHDACTHLLEDSNCRGITTRNNETIILECPNGSNTKIEAGCFKVYTSDQKLHKVCKKQIEERCVGISTPSNLTVLLECYNCLSAKGGSALPVYTNEERKHYRPFVESALYEFSQFNNALQNITTVTAYSLEHDYIMLDCFGQLEDYDIHLLRGHNNCRGITLENLETIVLDCPNKVPEKTGCYDIFSPVFGEYNNIIGPAHKVKNVCVKIVNEWCIGITTPRNWTVTLSCFRPSSGVCSIVTTPYNIPPPRM